MISVPGSFTPTEILAAIAIGSQRGKAVSRRDDSLPLLSRQSELFCRHGFPLFAVGGIHTENMSDYMQHGINGFGIGSALYKPGKSLSEIRRDTNSLVSAYRNNTDRMT